MAPTATYSNPPPLGSNDGAAAAQALVPEESGLHCRSGRIAPADRADPDIDVATRRLIGQFADQLFITAGTAKTHVAPLLAKLGARDRVQLVITACQAGLFDT